MASFRKLSTWKLKELKEWACSLLKDGIGDIMDKTNLWFVPVLMLIGAALLISASLSKIAFDEPTCNNIDFTGTDLDKEAKSYCQTGNGKRYWLKPNEYPSSLDSYTKTLREVNPERIRWFWGPILFFMCAIPVFLWTLLMGNRAVNFTNIDKALKSIMVKSDDGIADIDEVQLAEKLRVITGNFCSAYSTRLFAAFITFEFGLVLAPLILLLFIFPSMIGSNFRTYGFDVVKAWHYNNNWQDTPFGSNDYIPLFPRTTYCDFHSLLGALGPFTYQCFLDVTWYERTALITWTMLAFLAFTNFLNFIIWVEFGFRMMIRSKRRRWVINKWLNKCGFSNEMVKMRRFAEGFKLGQLLYFYYIEAHTDRVVQW